jgi:catechol 2,3-dioxygenase-like lactoylglutathione lyase family enzyme
MSPGAPRARPPTALLTSLAAQDLTATRDFYVRDLGLSLAVDEPTRLVVRVGGTSLEFRQHDDTLRIAADVRLTFHCDDPVALLRRLRSLGVEVDVPPGPNASAVAFTARDPDGRRVAFTAPTRPEDG